MTNMSISLLVSNQKSWLLSFMQIGLNSMCLWHLMILVSPIFALSLTLWLLNFIDVLKIGMLVTKSRCCLQKWNKGLYSIWLGDLKMGNQNARSKIRLCFCFNFSQDFQMLISEAIIIIIIPWLTLLVSCNLPGKKV